MFVSVSVLSRLAVTAAKEKTQSQNLEILTVG